MKKISNTNEMPKVGKTVQRLRQANKYSLGDLADQAGVSKSIISQIERNETNPTISTIWRLSNALHTTVEEIVGAKKNLPFFDKITGNATPIIKSEDGLCYMKVVGVINTVEWVQWYEFFAEPGGVLESEGHQPGSTEHLTMISGNLEILVTNHKQSVAAGETIRYRCDTSHVLTNHGKAPAHAIMVLILKSSGLSNT